MEYALPRVSRFKPSSQIDEFDRALERAMKLLAVRSRSRRELADRLLGMGFGPVAVEKVDRRLAALGLVDDTEFALERVRHLLARGRSLRAAHLDLSGHGIGDDVIEFAVAEVDADQPELSRAVAIANARARRSLGETPRKTYARVARYLSAQGFDPETVEEACREVFGDIEP